jgi:mycothiol synthase
MTYVAQPEALAFPVRAAGGWMSTFAPPYRHPQDLERLAAFLSFARQDVGNSHYLHVGDLTWQLFHMLADAAPPGDIIQLWETGGGEILGFVLLYPPSGFFDLQLHPDHRGSPLEAEMLAWAEARLASGGPSATLVAARDIVRAGLLRSRGYQPSGTWHYLEASLQEPVPSPALPSGWVVRSVAGTEEAAQRAAVLAAAFGAPTRPERYHGLMQAEGYEIELDVVAVAESGQFAAFALGWIDPVARVGQFEPVGTHPAFRKQGLARAVLVEGMQRMERRGAERVVVIVEEAEEAACQLYASIGLRRQWDLTLYTKN